ncbi:hypothetical protein DEJ34_03835 [Curtobacterium sp. MCPF17_050]|uniref:hypothetical protein n=1 Tax=Curtobacterium sp. MCPF17_050 TaxID=2175664 RepID=UPI0011B742AA|nr:hypothetical protein [Curtobacterium sp. MCPF17_050]WIB16274.1 hypothetical protein DEJ34_03835 [Curtobacterium sp. MCPF17_050]
MANFFRPGMSAAEAAAALVAAEKSPEPAATGRGEIQNQERDQIMDETSGRIVAWTEFGPQGERGPLWEVTIERLTADEPWTLYAAFEGFEDGAAQFEELSRCASAGYRAERELMRLTDPERWARGEMAARHPELLHRSVKPLEAYVAKHSYRCALRGCTMYGLFHVDDDETQVRHTALHATGRGWELEVATAPGSDRWQVLTSGGRVVSADDPRDFAAAFSTARRRVDELNGSGRG